MELHELQNQARPFKRRKRVGRGVGSGMGKTSCRGQKGAGARSGYKRRHGYVGGGLRLFQRLPKRGFSRGRWLKRLDVVNLGQLDKVLSDGDMIDEATLRKRGLLSGPSHGIKLLGEGKLTKKVAGCQVTALSKSAREALESAGVSIG
jgi:large subunit ribosomal protein L15